MNHLYPSLSLLLVKKYGNTSWLGMNWFHMAICSFIKYRSSSQKVYKQNSARSSLQTTSLCYSIAKPTLEEFNNVYQIQEIQHENLPLVCLLSLSPFLILILSLILILPLFLPLWHV